ncbi:MAG TPA: hypothetical protein VI299_20325 [Polyangiales bacterium]
MPNASDILANLSAIASQARVVAIAWHVVVVVVIMALLSGLRPSKRTAAMLLSLPLASVGIIAWRWHNPFNAIVFVGASLALTTLASRGRLHDRVRMGSRFAIVCGAGLLTYAWSYPHFLAGPSAIAYLYGAPLGIIPCPTLALAVAATLLGDGLVGGAWCLTLAGLAMFYAVFGIARLGVALDWGLLVGTAALLSQHWRTAREVSA